MTEPMREPQRMAIRAVPGQTVYREGSRIRATNGMGYSDAVSDEDIEQHLHEERNDTTFIAFANAVLAIREYERAARAGESTGEIWAATADTTLEIHDAPPGADPDTD